MKTNSKLTIVPKEDIKDYVNEAIQLLDILKYNYRSETFSVRALLTACWILFKDASEPDRIIMLESIIEMEKILQQANK